MRKRTFPASSASESRRGRLLQAAPYRVRRLASIGETRSLPSATKNLLREPRDIEKCVVAEAVSADIANAETSVVDGVVADRIAATRADKESGIYPGNIVVLKRAPEEATAGSGRSVSVAYTGISMRDPVVIDIQP